MNVVILSSSFQDTAEGDGVLPLQGGGQNLVCWMINRGVRFHEHHQTHHSGDHMWWSCISAACLKCLISHAVFVPVERQEAEEEFKYFLLRSIRVSD